MIDPLTSMLHTLAVAPGDLPVEVELDTSFALALQQVPAGVGLLSQTASRVLLSCETTNLDRFARLLLVLDCPLGVINPRELPDALRNLSFAAAQYVSAP